jgi:serine/threonine-protein kinase
VARDSARALAAVHACGVTHRDIKPDNLFLVGARGAPRAVKVLDFGMAHLAPEARSALASTRPLLAEREPEERTSILGTAQYMAPEQILVEAVDARTDVYALGVVLFRMLTGHLPFEAHGKKDLLRHQLFSPVPPVTWLEESVPEGLARLVRRCTRKCPDRRPSSMGEVLAELEGLALTGDATTPAADQLAELSWGDYESDVYRPRTERGRAAAELLAREFGVYSRPHSPPPPAAGRAAG